MRKSSVVHFTEPYVITSGARRRGPWFKQGHCINSPISVRHDAGLARGWIFILMIKKNVLMSQRPYRHRSLLDPLKKKKSAPCLCLHIRQQETRPRRLRSVYLRCLWRGLLQPQPLHCWGKARDNFQYSSFLLESSSMQRKKRPACSAFIRNLTSRFTSRFKAAGSISTKKLCLLVCLCRNMQSTAFFKLKGCLDPNHFKCIYCKLVLASFNQMNLLNLSKLKLNSRQSVHVPLVLFVWFWHLNLWTEQQREHLRR